MALAWVLAALLATNLLTDRLAPGLYLPTRVVAAVALLLIARRAGLGWAELELGRATVRSGLGWALVTSAIVLAAYVVLLAIPAGRTVLSDSAGRRADGRRAALVRHHRGPAHHDRRRHAATVTAAVLDESRPPDDG